MSEVSLLVTSSTVAVHNIIKAHKHKKGADHIRCCINELKEQLKKDQEEHEKIMFREHEEFKVYGEKLIEAEKYSTEKIENIRESLRNRKDSIRWEFENALTAKEDKIKQCCEDLIQIQKENTELIRQTITEMQGELNKVMDGYINKEEGVDEELNETFKQILEIQNEYRKRVDRLSDLHREETKRKELEHYTVLREKDALIRDIMNKCFLLHNEIQCIQDKRVEDIHRMIRFEGNCNMPSECVHNLQGLESSAHSGSTSASTGQIELQEK